MGRLPLDPAWLRAGSAATLRRQVAAFGHGGERPGLFGIGPHPGSSAGGWPTWRSDARSRGPASTRRRFLARVGKATGFVRAHITGELAGVAGDAPPVALALAVNGRVAAVSRTLAGGRGASRSWSPSPPCATAPTACRCWASRHRGGGTFALLGQTGSGPRPCTLVGDAIRAADGRRITLAAGPRRGGARAGGRAGAAADGVAFDRPPAGRSSASSPLARLVYDARPRDLRPAVASALGAGSADLGWRADVPRDWHAAGARLRVFGVSGRTAGELPFVCIGDPPQGRGARA